MTTPRHINGIILSSKLYFEHDKLVTLFTPEMGKLRLLAKNTQRKKSTVMGRLEVSNHIQCTVLQGRSFWYLQQPEIITAFANIRTDFNRISLMSYWFDIIQKSTHVEQHNGDLFHLLASILSDLNQKKPLPELQARFYTDFLVLEGLWKKSDQRVSQQEFKSVFESYTGEPLPDLYLLS